MTGWSKILSGTLPVDELKKIKQLVTSKIDMGNSQICTFFLINKELFICRSRWGRHFPHLSRPALRTNPASCTMGPESFPGGNVRSGRDADPSPPPPSTLPKGLCGLWNGEIYLKCISELNWCVVFSCRSVLQLLWILSNVLYIFYRRSDLDTVVRDEQGNILDPDITSTIQFYWQHELATERIGKSTLSF
jgi:hypothetical protein